MNRIRRKENPVNPNGLTFPVNRMKFGSMRGPQGQSVILPFHYPRRLAPGQERGRSFKRWWMLLCFFRTVREQEG